jgi:hypothetical protein
LARAALLTAAGCGSSPTTPPSPTPTPPPSLGGTLTGRYILRVEPAAECAAPAVRFSFAVQAVPADTPRYAGVEVLLEGESSSLEIELQSTSPTVRGGLGTTERGAAAMEGMQLWIHGIGSGTVTNRGGPGEVAEGTLSGELAFGRNEDDEGSLGTCASLGHRWSLRLS